MDNIIYDFFKELKFDDSEIATLISIAPTLEELSVAEAEENMNAVISFGYPVSDITYLISQNPSFLCRNITDLISDLKAIVLQYGDIEEALKSDPYLIWFIIQTKQKGSENYHCLFYS